MVHITLIHLLLVSTIGNVNTNHWNISRNFHNSLVDDIAVGILRKCFVSEGVNVIGFIGKLSPSIINLNRTLSSLTATILIDNPDRAMKGVNNRSATYPHPLSVFVLDTSDRYSAEQLLQSLKTTRWWNHAAVFIILDQRTPVEKISCINKARDVLLITWKLDILSSIYFCTRYGGLQGDSVFAFAYNPYKESAPIPWTKVDIRSDYGGHPWTLFEQAYDSDKTTCDSVKFASKILDLNGFPISANAKSESTYLTIDSAGKTIDDLGGNLAPTLRAIWKKLNASISFKTYNSNMSFGNSFDDGSATGMIADLVHDRCDINLNLRYVRAQWGIRFSISQYESGLWIVSNHRGWKSTLTKITDFVRFELGLAVFLICLITVLVTGYSPFHFTLPDLMNVPRLFLNTGMIYLPKSMPQRLLLFATMLMVLIIHSLVQGKLAQLLTSRVSNQQVDTINDIQQFGYQIYGFGHLSHFIPPSLANSFHTTKKIHHGFCVDLLVNNRNAACFAPAGDLSIVVAQENLYISKTPFLNFREAYTTRKNWPLYNRFNTLIERLIDGGLTLYWDSRGSKFQEINRRLVEPAIRVLEYKDLIFALKILAVGLTISGVAFFFEVIVGYCKYSIDFNPCN